MERVLDWKWTAWADQQQKRYARMAATQPF